MVRKIILLLFIVIFITNPLFGQTKPASIEFRVLDNNREFSCEDVGPCFVKDVEIYDKSSRKKTNYYEGNEFDLSNLWGMDIIIHSQKVSLAYEETNRISRFIRERLYSLDCRKFAELVKNFSFFQMKRYSTPFSKDEIKVGNVLYMSKKETLHLAIYLGENLYLSKYGGEYEKIFVTTLEQLLSAYDGYKLYIVQTEKPL